MASWQRIGTSSNGKTNRSSAGASGTSRMTRRRPGSFAGTFYALCDVPRGGMQLQDGRRTRPTDLDPRVLQARLLDAYAVDLVPIDSVRSLFRRRRTPEPPAYVPSIRVVPVDDVR